MNKHGHFCKVCQQYKANEKFSGKGHATHICKKCAVAVRAHTRAVNKAKKAASDTVRATAPRSFYCAEDLLHTHKATDGNGGKSDKGVKCGKQGRADGQRPSALICL